MILRDGTDTRDHDERFEDGFAFYLARCGGPSDAFVGSHRDGWTAQQFGRRILWEDSAGNIAVDAWRNVPEACESMTRYAKRAGYVR